MNARLNLAFWKQLVPGAYRWQEDFDLKLIIILENIRPQ